MKNNNAIEDNDIRKKIIKDYWIKKISSIDDFIMPQDGESSFYCFNVLDFDIDPQIISRIKNIGKGNQINEYIILLSFFIVLLYKYYGHSEILISAPPLKDEANIDNCSDEDILLFFKSNLDEFQSIKKLLQDIRNEFHESIAYIGCDFKEIQALLGKKGIRENLLCRFGFFDNRVNSEFPELAHLGLQLRIEANADGNLNPKIKYDKNIFYEDFIRRFISHYRNVLSYVNQSLDISLGNVEILSTSERKELLVDFNDTDSEYPYHKTIHELFEAQAEQTPDHIALVGFIQSQGNEKGQITYKELYQKSTRLALYLRENGVIAENIVGICIERSIGMIIGILAILQAGAAYLPIDTEYPEDRKQFILADSGASFLVTDDFINKTTSLTHFTHLTQSCSVAYIIYTSGTTGRPKGVMVSHKNVARLFFNNRFQFDFNSKDVWTMFHSYCFDFSVWEMYGAILFGGKLISIPRSTAIDARHYLQVLKREAVTVLNQTPSAFYLLLENELQMPDKLLYLKYIIFGGEVLHFGKLKGWQQKYPLTKLINMYGITETTVHVTYKEISREEIEAGINNIGKPITTVSVYIMDIRKNLIPVGLIGEIYVGGAGVARGYLNRPELTAQRFISLPAITSGFLYKTGDLARWLPDGNLEYRGRMDFQVKIRGYRIECGEIESKLMKIDDLTEVLVITDEDEYKNQYMIAYFTSKREVKPIECYTFLEKILPSFMIPAFFVQVKQFPLTSTGKIDRNALPKTGLRNPSKSRYEVPNNDIEKKLIKIWQEILNVDDIGINDDFFRLGGNSLLGIRVVNKIQEWLGEIIHVTALFSAPTIKELAVTLEPYRLDTTIKVDKTKVDDFKKIIKPLPPRKISGPKNPPIALILSPPRCGTTLLRVILAGHPELFSPPELELLSFNTLMDRKEELTGKFGYFAEGTIRAIMEIKECSADEAQSMMKGFEQQGLTIQEFYRTIQQWLGKRLLIDKTPWYAMNLDILKRAEDYFEEPRYLHLLRNPYAVIHSFENARLDQIFRYEHSFSSRELAELVWLTCNQNILEFFKLIPPERKLTVKFEELVQKPKSVTQDICSFFSIEYREEMIKVYQNTEKKMIDGILPESKMLGDINFFTHTEIDPRIKDNWQEKYKIDFLGDITVQFAQSLGYLEDRINSHSFEIMPALQLDHYPLSPGQKRLWILDQFKEINTTYNIPLVIRVEGYLNREVLEKTFEFIIRRHESFRTTFTVIEGVPYQKIHDFESTGFKLQYIDLKDRIDRDDEVNRLVLDELKIPFDLQQGPLLKVILIYLEEKNYIFLFNVHHIICDGWSMNLLINELFVLYEAYTEHKENPLSPMRIQYKDYSQWLKGENGSRIMNRAAHFWLKEFSGEIPVLNLPTDYTRPTAQSFDGSIVSGDLSLAQTKALNEIAQSEGVTLFVVLFALYNILLSKLSGQEDIIVGTPIAGRRNTDLEIIIGMFVNTLALRSHPAAEKSFIDFLREVKENTLLAFENQDYQFEDLVEKVSIAKDRSRNPLFDVMFVFQNSFGFTRENFEQETKNLKITPYFNEHSIAKFDLTLSCNPVGDMLYFSIEYCIALFKKETIERFLNYFNEIISSVINNSWKKIGEIELISKEEKNKILYDFNNTMSEYPEDKTFLRLFEEQAIRAPNRIAVCFPVELNNIFQGTSCFKKNLYIFQSDLEYRGINYKLLKTQHHNGVVVNSNMLKLIELFDGEENIESIYYRLMDLTDIRFIIFNVEIGDMLEITYDFNRKAHIFSNMKFDGFISLVKLLYESHLIELTAVKPDKIAGEKERLEGFDPGELFSESVGSSDIFFQEKTYSRADILLLGDTPGMPTTGLLYLASYLKRNGVNALCRFYDRAIDYQSMKTDIESLLEQIRPGIVAISLKWFLYIARVLDMGKIINEYALKNNLSIKVVVGGNTASYYWTDIIKFDYIDCVIRGDGEFPLLQLCKGEHFSNIPNCVYKSDGNIIQTPFSYVKDIADSSDIYLSHLNEIIFPAHTAPLGTFFIFTHLGCARSCIYCGGCNNAQEETFNRKTFFIRPAAEVRKDIIEVMPYTSTFQFDFDTAPGDILEYCRDIWKNIDLSGHFAIISRLHLPSSSFIEFVTKTFKYVYWDLDVLTLSEKHRERLVSFGLVKPQLTDSQILALLDEYDKYDNVEVRFNMINGLPYFTLEDIELGEKFLTRIMSSHRSFSELHWARLHAQPGAPITSNAEKYEMRSFATRFEDFLEYSKQNFNSVSTVRLEHLNYPYVYFNDDVLNSKLTLHYSETNKKIQQYKENKLFDWTIGESLTYEQLNIKADRLAGLLRNRGISTGSIAGIMLNPSIDIPVAVLAVWKAGAAYLPIDPDYPQERIDYMLKDSGAKILINCEFLMNGEYGEKISKSSLPTFFQESTVGDRHACPSQPLNFSTSQLLSSAVSAAYIIYTSGTTGKPKGVIVTHQNLVNYACWFTQKSNITHLDKTILTSSFAFDLGYTSIFPSLLNGCELHMLPREIYLSPGKLLDYIDKKGITYIKVTPSLLSIIVNSLEFSPRKCRSLRLSVVGGEPIHLNDIETAHDVCEGLEIINHYGPTEATIGCIAHVIDFNCFEEYKINPTIGKPIANVEAYILDKNLNLLPVRIPGELYISGAGVGSGYLNNPELTFEKFISTGQACLSPTLIPGILYKTGDLARWTPDGNIEFLGRVDNQVKIRGYRVEVEEIKNNLLKQAQIKEAFVLPREDKDGNKYLCAYIVPERGEIEIKNEETPKALTLKEIETKLNINSGIENEVIEETIVDVFEKQVEQFPGKIAIESNGKTSTYGAINRYANRIGRLIVEKYDDRYKLSDSEKIRYKRQMLLYGWGKAFQEKLKSVTVFVAGAGGGGSPTIMQLALLGVGTIKICDYDEIELSNLNRQFLHDEERIGMNKALSAQVTVNKINPNVTVIPVKEKLTRENVFELVGESDIIFDMFDGLADKFILSECAVVKQIPHIIISMADLNAYSAVLHTPHTPCYHCIFSKEKLDTITAGMKNVVENYSKNPLAVAISSLFMSTASVVNEALKILMGVDEPAYNKFFYFNQRGGNKHLRDTPSYKSMTHLFSDHFRKISREQGFDWDTGWRGNLLDVLDIVPDPDCPLCGEKSKEKRIELERQLKKYSSEVIPVQIVDEHINNQIKPVALLVDEQADPFYFAASIMGTLKAGKTFLYLNPTWNEQKLSDNIENSEVRVILTDNKNRDTAEKLKHKINSRMQIIHVDEIDETIKEENLGFNVEAGNIAYLQLDASGMGISFLEILAKLIGSDLSFFNSRDREVDAFSLTQLRENLSKSLPDYMIPSYFIELEKLPLTSNGKIDQKNLPEPGTAIAVQKNSRPPNEVEKKLIAIWSDIVGIAVDKIGIEQNLFELGGNSLHLISLVSRIHQEFGVEAPIARIFESPTIKGIAIWINSNNFSDSPVALLNRPEKKKIFLFPPQLAYGAFYVPLASIFSDYSFYAFSFIEEEDRLDQYVRLITNLQPEGPYIFFGYSAAGRLAFQVARELEKRGHEVSDIIFIECFFTEGQAPVINEEFLKGHYELIEEIMDRAGLSFLKEKVIKKSVKFMEHCGTIDHLEKINTAVHLILTEEFRNRENGPDPRCWDNVTSKTSLLYDGYGTHLTVFYPGVVEKNAEVIRGILDRIESERHIKKN